MAIWQKQEQQFSNLAIWQFGKRKKQFSNLAIWQYSKSRNSNLAT
jgi:hypothetical protein